MKAEIEKQINDQVQKVLGHLSSEGLYLAKALCRAAYNMGYDNGVKSKPILELVNADEVLEAINKKNTKP